ncbi:MAG: R3H domain-containing nucleic acid-binding protein [Patescibacteria group bacterium]|jgi:spoIIIJ-associated protein
MDKEKTKWLERTLKEFFADWPLKPAVEVTAEEQTWTVRVNTGKDFIFIQPNAQPLLAAQHLLRLMFKKQFPDSADKLLLDIGNFREQQQTALAAAVKEAIWQTKASGNSVHLSPMSSFERRVVHMLIAAEPELASESMGAGESRHVVIKLNAK